MKSCSSILTKLWRLSSEESVERLVSAIAEVNESLSMRNVCTQEHSDDSCASSQFLQKQKVHLIYLQKFLEKKCDVLPVFGFRSASFDITLIQSYLLPSWTANNIQIPWLSKKLSTASFSILVEQKHNQVSRRLSCAARVNLGFVFVLNSIQRGKFRVLSAQETIILLDRSIFFCTGDDVAKSEENSNKTDVIGMCIREKEREREGGRESTQNIKSTSR